MATAALVERAQTAQKLTVEMNRGFDDSGKARRRAPHLTANGVHIAMAFSQNRRKHRINLMFDALSRAGQYQQIIVLTCRLRSFAPLGGHTLRVQMNGARQ